MQKTDVASKSCSRGCWFTFYSTAVVEIWLEQEKKNKKPWSFWFWITTQKFPFLFKALLFIHVFLQQQITEAVLKIKVFFFFFKVVLVKKTKTNSAQNLNDSTKRSVNMPCKWWGRDITVGKSILSFSIMKTSQYFLHFRII